MPVCLKCSHGNGYLNWLRCSVLLFLRLLLVVVVNLSLLAALSTYLVHWSSLSGAQYLWSFVIQGDRASMM